MIECKICGSNTRVIRDTQFEIDYYKCLECEFIQMDDKYKVSYEDERAVYDLHENSLECEGYVNMFRKFLDESVMPFRRNGCGLDFGSGPTPVLMQLINRDYEFDMENYDLHFQPDKVYENKKYNLVVSTEVVEHLLDPMESFELIYSILDEGGVFAFMTMIHNNDDESFKDWWYRRDKTHISFYSEKTLKYIADKIGFDFVYSDKKRVFTFIKK